MYTLSGRCLLKPREDQSDSRIGLWDWSIAKQIRVQFKKNL
jgi:hypothetical protein